MTSPQYELSKSWMTDSEPVRSVGYTQNALMSGSEGGILSSTSLAEASMTINTETVNIQPGGEGTRHSHQITALLGSHEEDNTSTVNGNAIYVTGCKDHLIRVFDAESHALVTTLRGHDNAVTSLSWLPLPTSNNNNNNNNSGRILISGSWDGTAKLWWMSSSNVQECSCIATLPGHENTVSVAGLPPLQNTSVARLATGSAGVANGSTISDHKIRMWDIEITFKGGEGMSSNSNPPSATVTLKHTVTQDHSGPIRGLVYDASSQMLLSCSNDGTVKVRDSHTGQAITTLSFQHHGSGGQPPMLLSVTSAPGGYIMASGEDGTVVIWNVNASGDDGVQIIPHPDCVWKVLALSNGDLVTACHDGTMRVFTTDTSRIAPPAEREALQQAVMASRQKSATGPSAEEIAALPKWDERATIAHMGQSEGQVKVFAKDGKAIAAQWSMASSTWIEVGEVTGRNDHAGTIDGVAYDHVFPIEVDVAGGGVQNLKIGYNNGENPFVTAQKFIDDYQLDQGYLAQIADYIRNRVGEAAGPTLGAGGNTNASANTSASANAVSSGPTPMEIEPSTPAPSPYANLQHLPMKGYRKFESGADMKVLTKMISKIQTFNTSALDSTNLSSAQMTQLEAMCQTLAATNRYHASTTSKDELEVVRSMMMNWSQQHVFPSIDLARLLALHPHAASGEKRAFWNDLVVAALDRCDSIATNAEGSGAGVEKTAIPMLSMRLFANCFRGGVGTQSAVETNLMR